MNIPRMTLNRRKLIAELVKSKTVLDIGCVDHDLTNRERGRWLHDVIKKSARSVVGLDYEKAAVDALNSEGYEVVHADGMNFNLGRTFQVVVAGEFIEHITCPGAFLSCVRKHLEPDGILVLTTPNANSMIYFAENLLLGHEIDNPDHTCIFTPVTMSKLLEKCDMEALGYTFIAENTAYCHKALWAKWLVYIKLAVQLLLGVVRPSLCHHFLVVACIRPSA